MDGVGWQKRPNRKFPDYFLNVVPVVQHYICSSLRENIRASIEKKHDFEMQLRLFLDKDLYFFRRPIKLATFIKF